MTPRIEKAINIFLDAINSGTLAKGTCVACAVGNLVAHGMDMKIDKDMFGFCFDMPNTKWHYLFMTTRDGVQRFAPFMIHDYEVNACIEATEFSWKELAKIEYAFETNTRIEHTNYDDHTPNEIKQDQINGLEAVIEVMMGFDNVVADVKEVFTSKVMVKA